MDTTEEAAMLKKLVAMLKERGVEFRDFIDEPDAYVAVGWAVDGRAYKIYRIDTSDGTLCIDGLTPEQAITATLGSCNCTNSERTGTCHNASKVMDEHGQARFACSECGAWIYSRMLWNPECRNGESPWVKDCKLNFCPNCGRRIVGPTTNDVDAEVDA